VATDFSAELVEHSLNEAVAEAGVHGQLGWTAGMIALLWCGVVLGAE
jgi:hypothetical protein